MLIILSHIGILFVLEFVEWQAVAVFVSVINTKENFLLKFAQIIEYVCLLLLLCVACIHRILPNRNCLF